MVVFRDSLVVTLNDPVQSFNLLILSIEARNAVSVTFLILAANGTLLSNITIHATNTR